MRDANNSVSELAKKVTELEDSVRENEKSRDQVHKQIAEMTRAKGLEDKRELYRINETYRCLLDEETVLVSEIEKCTSRLTILRNDLAMLTESPSIVADKDIELTNFDYPRNFYVQAKGNVKISSPLTGSLEALSSASLKPSDALQPGSTAVYSMVLKTSKHLFFRPLQYLLEYSLNYSFDSSHKTVHVNRATQLLTIRAPISSVMAGAIVGGFVGYFTRVLPRVSTNTHPSGDLLAGLGSHIIPLIITVALGAMAVVFVARRAEVQPFITIEDFWGGTVIGFLVGYVGTDFFNTLAKVTPQSSTVTLTPVPPS